MSDDLRKEFEAFKAEVLERLDALEAGGSVAAAPAAKKKPGDRPATAAPLRSKTFTVPAGKNGTEKKGAAPPRLTSAKRKKSVDGGEKKQKEDTSGQFYYVGKRKVYYAIPSDSKDVADEAEAPGASLELEYAYGFNGKNAQGNLYYHKKGGKLVYSLAAAGVVFEHQKKSQQFFLGHTEDISALAIHPTQPIAATGQVDPKGKGKPYVCIWNYDTCKELCRLSEFHDRGITALGFSADGKYVFSIGQDDSHTLAMWEWEKDTNKPVTSAMVAKDEVYGISVNIYNKDALEFCTFGVKHLKIWGVGKDDEEKKKKDKITLKGVVGSSFNKTKKVVKEYNCATYLPNGDLVVGTGENEFHIYKGDKFQKLVDAHKGAVNAVCVVDEAKGSFATGGQDGKLKVYDSNYECSGETEVSKKIRSMDCFEGKTIIVGTGNNAIFEVTLAGMKHVQVMEGHNQEVWALAVHPTEPIFVTGAHDKNLFAWNYKTRSFVGNKSFKFEHAVRSAAFSPDGNTIAVGLKDGTIALLDYKTFSKTYEKQHRKETIDAIKFSPNGQLLAVGSWDQCAELIDLESKSSVILKGHTSSITHLMFSEDSKYLVTNSRDYEDLYWEVESSKRVERATLANVKWHEWSVILGWPVKGIWLAGYDGTDINAVCANSTNSLLATGDDYGHVTLFKYPALKPGKEKQYNGHSSHVTNVRFSKDSSVLFSAGGADTSVFQWRVVKA